MGPTIPELISKHGAIPGIKVDKGAKPLAGSIDETITEGLDGLRERLKEYYILGQDLLNGERFTKSVTSIQHLNQLDLMHML